MYDPNNIQSGNSNATTSTANNGSPTGSVVGDIGYSLSALAPFSVIGQVAQSMMDSMSPTSVTSSNAVNGMDSQSDAATAAGVAPAGSVNGGVSTAPSNDGVGAVNGVAGDAVDGNSAANGGLMPKRYEAGGTTLNDPYRTQLDDSIQTKYQKAQDTNNQRAIRAIQNEMNIRNANNAAVSKGLSGVQGLNGVQGLSDMQGLNGAAGLKNGGISDAHYNLGGYSDGGRLLRGPGDGVSDSIPATIGHKQPARLADGEFVVPARIVSELGNGSTEAGARKLYAMMDRVQKARGKTVGKNKVATNTRADKHLPA